MATHEHDRRALQAVCPGSAGTGPDRGATTITEGNLNTAGGVVAVGLAREFPKQSGCSPKPTPGAGHRVRPTGEAAAYLYLMAAIAPSPATG
jgi:hypothetical protein